MKVRGSMLVPGIVAAAHMSAGETETEMHPIVSELETFYTSIGVGRDLSDLIQMSTLVCHHNSLHVRRLY